MRTALEVYNNNGGQGIIDRLLERVPGSLSVKTIAVSKVRMFEIDHNKTEHATALQRSSFIAIDQNTSD